MNTDNKNPPTNYRLRDGDTVELLEPARVDQYWYCDFLGRSSWDLMYFLRGVTGKVIRARTPCTSSFKGKGENSCCFANVGIDCMGITYRVRVFHNTIRRVSTKAVTA